MSRRRFPLSSSGPGPVRTIVAVCILALMMACGGGNRAADVGTTSGTATGTITMTVEWEPPPASSAARNAKDPYLRPMAPAIDVCTDYGIEDMTMQALSGQTVLAESSVPCENHSATLNNVPAGNNLTLRIMGNVQGAGNVWNGFSASFALSAGETKDVGKISMSYTGNDTTPPMVLTASPTDNATHVPNNSAIRIQFSERMAVNTVQDNGTIVVADNVAGPVPGTITYNPSDNSATFTPNAPLASGAKISVVVTDVATDIAGNKLASYKPWNFLVHVPGQFFNPFLLELDDYPKYTLTSEIAMSGNGDAIAVWEQFDGTRMNIMSRRFSSSTGSWLGTEVIEYTDGDASYPQIAMDGKGNATVVWEQLAGTRRNIMFNQYTASTGIWSETGAGTLSNGTGDASSAQVAMDGNGNAIAVWSQYDGLRSNVWYWRNGRIPGLLETNDAGDANWPEIAMSGNGDAIAVWEQFDGTQNNIWANRYSASGNAWSGAFLLENNAGYANTPQIAMDKDSNAIAVWAQEEGGLSKIWANRYSASDNVWSGAFLLENSNAGNSYDPQVAMDGNGNAIVVWSHNDGNVSLPTEHIWANRYSASGNAWSGAFLLENNAGYTNLPHIAMGGNGDAMVTWREPGGGPIWYNRYSASTGAWSGELILSIEGGSHLRPAMDGNGNAIAVWDNEFAGRLTSHVYAAQTR